MLKYSNPVSKAIVPEWKYCEYNNYMLEGYLQKLQQMATLFKEGGQESSSMYYHSGHPQERAIKLSAIIRLQRHMIKVNQLFEKAQNKEMQVIERFAKMKILQLNSKYDFYLAALKYTPVADEDSLTLLENIFIEACFLEKLIKHSLQHEEQILQDHHKMADQVQQLQTPLSFNGRTVHRILKNLIKIKDRIELAYMEKKDPKYTSKDKKEFRWLASGSNDQGQLKFMGFGVVVGLILFMVSLLTIIIVVNGINLSTDVVFQTHFPIWRGLGSVIFFIWVIGICSIIFQNSQINYQRILTLQRQTIPSPTSILIFAALFTAFYLVCFIIYVIKLSYKHFAFLEFIPLQNIPGICWILFIAFLFLPVHFQSFNKKFRGRAFTQLMIIRMFISFFIGVQFVSNWLSENLSSFKQPFQDLTYSFLYYWHGQMRFDNEDTSLYVGAWLGTSIFILRILQSLRNGLTFCNKPLHACLSSYLCTSPFARGALKCIFNIGTVWVSYFYRVNIDSDYADAWMFGWLAMGLVSSCYAFCFDIMFDWNLFTICTIPCCGGNPNKTCVREDRVFSSKWIYYVSVVVNFFLRLLWMLTLSTDFVTAFFGNMKYLIIMGLSFAEFGRRGLWNIFMIEKQHVKNCLKFQAIVNYETIQNRIKRRFIKANPKQAQKHLTVYNQMMMVLKGGSQNKDECDFVRVQKAVAETKKNFEQFKDQKRNCNQIISEMEKLFNIYKNKS